jgi:regulator of RNase E activity RraA
MIDFNVIREKLNSSIISDVLDGMGIKNNAMSMGIRPLDPDMSIVGRAFTLLMADQYDLDKDTFTLQFEAIDGLNKDDVMMVCSNGSTRAALWGELLSTAAHYRGASGAVIDGLARDVKLIQDMKFPVFCKGIRPISSKGRVIAVDYGCPVNIGGVMVNPGDLIVADCDGVVVVPHKITEKVIDEALDVVTRETKTREELRNGALLSEVYKKYGTV